jgi:hypothetical protein
MWLGSQQVDLDLERKNNKHMMEVNLVDHLQSSYGFVSKVFMILKVVGKKNKCLKERLILERKTNPLRINSWRIYTHLLSSLLVQNSRIREFGFDWSDFPRIVWFDLSVENVSS